MSVKKRKNVHATRQGRREDVNVCNGHGSGCYMPAETRDLFQDRTCGACGKTHKVVTCPKCREKLGMRPLK